MRFINRNTAPLLPSNLTPNPSTSRQAQNHERGPGIKNGGRALIVKKLLSVIIAVTKPYRLALGLICGFMISVYVGIPILVYLSQPGSFNRDDWFVPQFFMTFPTGLNRMGRNIVSSKRFDGASSSVLVEELGKPDRVLDVSGDKSIAKIICYSLNWRERGVEALTWADYWEQLVFEISHDDRVISTRIARTWTRP